MILSDESMQSTNLIVPLEILALDAGPVVAEITFRADLEKQYYENAHMRFTVPDVGALRMKHMPVFAALRRRNGQWVEIYDQDERFQKIGQVIDNPSWTVNLTDTSVLVTATITARIDLQFLSYIQTVRERHLEFYDVVMELTGIASVEDGYPKSIDGVTMYGTVNFRMVSFDAIYIVPKGGPSPDVYLL